MRIPVRSRFAVSQVSMTPMIDVVFLLIIFFLVSSHLARREIRFPVDLPDAATGDRMDPQVRFITITIDDQPQIRMGGQVVSIAKMQTLVQQRLTSRPDAVRLRVDQSTPYRSVRTVLQTLTAMGIREIDLASERPR